MLAVNYSTLRNNLKEYCDTVTNNNETVIITRKDEKNVVLISLEEYNNMLENLKILKNPAYFIELHQSLHQIKSGNIVLKDMSELEKMEQ